MHFNFYSTSTLTRIHSQCIARLRTWYHPSASHLRNWWVNTISQRRKSSQKSPWSKIKMATRIFISFFQLQRLISWMDKTPTHCLMSVLDKTETTTQQIPCRAVSVRTMTKCLSKSAARSTKWIVFCTSQRREGRKTTIMDSVYEQRSH